MAKNSGVNLVNRLKRYGRTANGGLSFINEWDAVRFLGKGTYGVVYEISKNSREMGTQHSALKIIELDEKSINKYKDEVKALECVRNHPHGVGVEDFSELYVDEGDFQRSYLIIRMELLEPLLKQGMTENAVIQMALDVSNVLIDCHSRMPKLLHCDIKPENILKTSSGKYKLSDFGEVRFLEKSRGSSGMRGTPLYMSPEMWSLNGYDERSDLYSLGVTMHAMLNGYKAPFLNYPPYSEEIIMKEKRFAEGLTAKSCRE